MTRFTYCPDQQPKPKELDFAEFTEACQAFRLGSLALDAETPGISDRYIRQLHELQNLYPDYAVELASREIAEKALRPQHV